MKIQILQKQPMSYYTMGIMIMMALRISDIASGLGFIFTASVPLIVGACIAFVFDIF